jgi:hypothetical protein
MHSRLLMPEIDESDTAKSSAVVDGRDMASSKREKVADSLHRKLAGY